LRTRSRLAATMHVLLCAAWALQASQEEYGAFTKLFQYLESLSEARGSVDQVHDTWTLDEALAGPRHMLQATLLFVAWVQVAVLVLLAGLSASQFVSVSLVQRRVHAE
jgi:hypothetical protein